MEVHVVSAARSPAAGGVRLRRGGIRAHGSPLWGGSGSVLPLLPRPDRSGPLRPDPPVLAITRESPLIESLEWGGLAPSRSPSTHLFGRPPSHPGYRVGVRLVSTFRAARILPPDRHGWVGFPQCHGIFTVSTPSFLPQGPDRLFQTQGQLLGETVRNDQVSALSNKNMFPTPTPRDMGRSG